MPRPLHDDVPSIDRRKKMIKTRSKDQRFKRPVSTAQYPMRCLQAALVSCGVLALVAGCQEAGPSIRGRVTVDGSDLVEGAISLRPLPGTSGPSVGGEIVGGQFHIGGDAGLAPGKYRVEITAMQESGETMVDPSFGTEVPVAKQFLPVRYNTNSELVLEVAAGRNEGAAFELTTE